MEFTRNCIYIDESGFDIDRRRSKAWSKEDVKAVIATASTRVQSYTVIGAISALGVVVYNTPFIEWSKPDGRRRHENYICVHLPPQYPESNTIEQFWAIAKYKVKG